MQGTHVDGQSVVGDRRFGGVLDRLADYANISTDNSLVAMEGPLGWLAVQWL